MEMRMIGRRLCGMLLALCLFAGLMPAAAGAPLRAGETELFAAAEGTELSEGLELSVENGSVCVRYSGTVSPVVLVAAGYDKTGKMRTAETRTVASGSQSVFAYNSAYIYQAFALQPGTFMPLCKSDGMTTLPETGVEVPMIDGAVAESAAAAVNQLAQARLLLEELLTADFNGVAGNEQKYNAISAQLDSAIEAYDLLMTASAVLWKTASAAAEAGQSALAKLGGQESGLRSVPEEDQLHWAQKLTEQYDSIRGNFKLGELGRMLGCDAREAYRQLSAAQDILRGKYMGEAETAERWVKGLTVVKTGAKVGMLVCGTIATGGVVIAGGSVAMGSVTAVEATGLLIGGVDTAIDVATTTATVTLGSDHKLVKIMEHKSSTVSNASFLFSLCTLNGANMGEKLACFGDFIEKTKNYYNEVTTLFNWRPDLNKLRAKARSGKFLSGPLKEKMAEDVPEQQTDAQIRTALGTAVTSLQEQRGPVTGETLQTIVDEAKDQGLIPEDTTLANLRSELSAEVAAETVDVPEAVYELPMDAKGPFTINEWDVGTTSHYVESYNAAGQKHGLWLQYSYGYLYRERYYIEDQLQWERNYCVKDDHVSRVYVYAHTEEGAQKTIRSEEYYPPDELPEGVDSQVRYIYGYELDPSESTGTACIYAVSYKNDGSLGSYSTGRDGVDIHRWIYYNGYLDEEYFDQGGRRYKYYYFSDPDYTVRAKLGHISAYRIFDLTRWDQSESNYLTLRRETWESGGTAEFPYVHSVWVYNESTEKLERIIYHEPST